MANVSTTDHKVSELLQPFSPLAGAVAHFGKRNIGPELIRSNSLRLIAWEEMNALVGSKWYPATSADFIPYHDLDGTPLPRERGGVAIRFRRHVKGSEEGPKYISPPKAGSYAYLPQIPGRTPWTEIAANPAETLAITEGEYKALRGMAMDGSPAVVGLGGVWMFRNSLRTGFCNPLNKFVWAGRQVVIVFDADEESTKENPFKPSVKQALEQLASMLRSAGATVVAGAIARTDRYVTGTKMGLDDYLDAGGSWDELGQTFEQLNTHPLLAEMMGRYAVYKGSSGHVLDIKTMAVHTRNNFATLIESNKKMPEADSSGKIKTVRVVDKFLDSTDRPEFDRYDFRPELEPGLDLERRLYNGWKGFEHSGVRNERLAGVYEKFMRGLCGEHFDYVMSWLAHMVQKPWEKTSIGLICMSNVQGCGKTLMGELVGGAIGNGMYVNDLLANLLGSNFNALLEYKLLVQSDEGGAFYSGYEDKIKDLITKPTITIERKGQDRRDITNVSRLFITTNSLTPIRLDKDNRRMFVWQPPISAEANKEWSAWVRSNVIELKNTAEGREAVMSYLMDWDISKWDASAPVPMTEEAHDLVGDSYTKNDSVANEFYDRVVGEGMRWLVVDSGLSRGYTKVWSQFRSLVKQVGGNVMDAQYISGGVRTKVKVYDLGGGLKFTETSDRHKSLKGNQLSSEELALNRVKVNQLFSEVSEGIKHSDKY